MTYAAADPTSLTSVLLGILIAVLTVTGMLGAAWPYFRGRAAKSYTELLEKSLTAERDERKAEQVKCSEQIAELRGRVNVMTEGFAKSIGAAVAQSVVPVVEAAISRANGDR